MARAAKFGWFKRGGKKKQNSILAKLVAVEGVIRCFTSLITLGGKITPLSQNTKTTKGGGWMSYSITRGGCCQNMLEYSGDV